MSTGRGAGGPTVLVTDGNYKQSLAAVRALASSGFTVDVLGGDRCYSAASRHCRNALDIEGSCSDTTHVQLLDVLAGRDYDVLLPIGAQSVRWAAANRGLIRQYTALAVAPETAVELCFDKSATAEQAKTVGMRVPSGVVWDPSQPVSVQIADLQYPLVVKGGHELSTQPIVYANTASEVETALAMIPTRSAESWPVLIQEYVSGPGEGFFALYDDGDCRAFSMHRRIREYPASGGSSCCAESIHEPDLELAGRRLLDRIGWHGVAMVEFKRDSQTGELVLMEINPKFWGSLDLAIAAGVDFPSLTCRLALGEEVARSPRASVGVRFHWPLEGDLQHAVARPTSAPRVLADLVRPSVSSNIVLNDIGPTLRRLSVGAGQAVIGIPGVRHAGVLASRSRRIGWRNAFVRGWTELTGIPSVRYSQVADGILVGPQQRSLGRRVLIRHNVGGTLNLRSESNDEDHGWQVGDYRWLPIDEYRAPTISDLQDAVAFVESVNESGQFVYIHCREGVSRAATVAVACLLARGIPLEEALERVRTARPFVDILPIQLDALSAFESLLWSEPPTIPVVQPERG